MFSYDNGASVNYWKWQQIAKKRESENRTMDTDTYTITGGPLKPHEFVVVRREMTAADEAWIQNHSASMGGTKKKPRVQLNIGDIKLAALKRMITAWRLTKTIKDQDGSEREVEIQLSEHAIENLPRRISAFINKKIDELNPDEEEEDDEDFTSDANGTYEGSLQKTKSLHPKG